MEYYKNLDLEDIVYVNEEGAECIEQWKDVPEYLNIYQISDLGRVKSLSRYKNHPLTGLSFFEDRILKPRLNGHGYSRAALFKEGVRKDFRVHQLMANVFFNHISNGHVIVVDHINNIKTDNRKVNLQLISQRENASKDKVSKSGHTGVHFYNNIWVATISIKGNGFCITTSKDFNYAKTIRKIALENIEKFNGNIKDYRALLKSIANSDSD